MQNNETQTNADAVAAKADAPKPILASDMIREYVETDEDRPTYIEFQQRIQETKIDAAEFQAALLAYASQESPIGCPSAWAYLWAYAPVSSLTKAVWGGENIAFDNLPVIIKNQARIERWAQGGMPEGQLCSKLSLLSREGTFHIARFTYRAPVMPPLRNGLPYPLSRMQNKIEVDFDMVQEFMSETGACARGVADLLRGLGAWVDVEHDWDSYEGCIDCAQNDPHFDDDAELGIDGIKDMECFTLSRDDVESASIDSQYREPLMALFGGGLDWEEPQDCLNQIRGMMCPSGEDAKAYLFDGATFQPNIPSHIEALELNDSCWEMAHRIELALALAELCERFRLGQCLPPVSGTLFNADGNLWFWDGEILVRDSLRFTMDKNDWLVEGCETRQEDAGLVVVTEERGETAQVSYVIRNMGPKIELK